MEVSDSPSITPSLAFGASLLTLERDECASSFTEDAGEDAWLELIPTTQHTIAKHRNQRKGTGSFCTCDTEREREREPGGGARKGQGEQTESEQREQRCKVKGRLLLGLEVRKIIEAVHQSSQFASLGFFGRTLLWLC